MITIENTSYGYKSNPLIFNNISLEIGNGIYGLLGENGVGKTTLMHLICGLLFPKNGKCSIDGRNTAERQSEGLARYFFLPEELQMPTESIASFAARHSVFYPHFNQEEFDLNLEELKINRKQKLSSVSYGQQKKAMLAYAFALHTPYILLDEPTNGLDITSRQALRQISPLGNAFCCFGEMFLRIIFSRSVSGITARLTTKSNFPFSSSARA